MENKEISLQKQDFPLPWSFKGPSLQTSLSSIDNFIFFSLATEFEFESFFIIIE